MCSFLDTSKNENSLRPRKHNSTLVLRWVLQWCIKSLVESEGKKSSTSVLRCDRSVRTHETHKDISRTHRHIFSRWVFVWACQSLTVTLWPVRQWVTVFWDQHASTVEMDLVQRPSSHPFNLVHLCDDKLQLR